MNKYKIKLNTGFDSILKYEDGTEYFGLLKHKNIYHVIEKIKEGIGIPCFETLDVKFRSYRCTFYKKIDNLEIYDGIDEKQMLFLYLFNLKAYKKNIMSDGINIYTITTVPFSKSIKFPYDFDKKKTLYEIFPYCDFYSYKIRTKIQDIINSINNDYIYLENIFYNNLLKIIDN